LRHSTSKHNGLRPCARRPYLGQIRNLKIFVLKGIDTEKDSTGKCGRIPVDKSVAGPEAYRRLCCNESVS
jgi:hypothetical protein